jgi:hypothetical protein
VRSVTSFCEKQASQLRYYIIIRQDNIMHLWWFIVSFLVVGVGAWSWLVMSRGKSINHFTVTTDTD